MTELHFYVLKDPTIEWMPFHIHKDDIIYYYYELARMFQMITYNSSDNDVIDYLVLTYD